MNRAPDHQTQSLAIKTSYRFAVRFSVAGVFTAEDRKASRPPSPEQLRTEACLAIKQGSTSTAQI